MATAKEIKIRPISPTASNAICRRIHYSGKVVPNSQLHLGVFLNGVCEGVMQFGPPMDKSKVLPLVSGTEWYGMLELNRMAFSEALPRNSESRALGVALRLIKKQYPQIEWVLSYADGTQCGDGTIYRAAGFVLTSIKENHSIIKLPDGSISCQLTYSAHRATENNGKAGVPKGTEYLPGFQLRYIYFLNAEAKKRLTVPIVPYNKIQELGAAMYKGQKRAGSKMSVASPVQGEGGGAIPTPALQTLEKPESFS